VVAAALAAALAAVLAAALAATLAAGADEAADPLQAETTSAAAITAVHARRGVVKPLAIKSSSGVTGATDAPIFMNRFRRRRSIA
jgi:hypothetical protein